MLYTVSAVQILVTLDALQELEKHFGGGHLKVGQCKLPGQLFPGLR